MRLCWCRESSTPGLKDEDGRGQFWSTIRPTTSQTVKNWRSATAGSFTYYAQALEQLTGRTVKTQVIYSFFLGKEIVLSGTEGV